MARREILICDLEGERGCEREAVAFIVWRDGDPTAVEVDLCSVHSRPLEALLSRGASVPLPVKPRSRMEPTKLRTTPRTAGLKKRGPSNGPESTS